MSTNREPEIYHTEPYPVLGTDFYPPKCPVEGCPNSVVYWKQGEGVAHEMTCSQHREERKPPKEALMRCGSCSSEKPIMKQEGGGGYVVSWPCPCGGRYSLPTAKGGP